ncbi:hypothetical protein IV203_027587 [Nitzschia inconspicua]|uniref:Microtubule-associated protein Jupiter n=1 Tax=Nitzschia inconspicua TaxID=303405 RepID=A0A9K3M062_9STRA|nr:hypothetical protein IV203_027587 [Nitzschia inconspicua]
MSYSANNNQNFFVQSGRTTSRVLHTPGGECSISLGGYTPAELERMRQLREKRNGIKKVEDTGSSMVTVKENSTNAKIDVVSKEETKPSDVDGNPSQKEQKKDEEAVVTTEATTTQPQPTASKKGVSSNAFASSSTTNSFNVLTDRPTSRVTNPPGGKDNLWF